MCFTELKWMGVINKDSNDLLCQPNLLVAPHISLEINFSIKICLPTLTKLSSPDLRFSRRGWRYTAGTAVGAGVVGLAQFATTASQSPGQYFFFFPSNVVPCLGPWLWVIYSVKWCNLKKSKWRCLYLIALIEEYCNEPVVDYFGKEGIDRNKNV